MDCWNVLGINKTTDKETIKKAFHGKLPLFHPEDDPEGFKNLRAAYEEVLRFEETPQGENLTETDIWISKVKEVYSDFEKRIDIDSWNALLNDAVVVSLATNIEANDKLLEFLMNNTYLPHNVFALLESAFNWRENRLELINEFPVNFIDYIIYQSQNMGIRYNLFTVKKGQDYDKFLANYYLLFNNMYTMKPEQIEQLLKDTDGMDISHPDYAILKIRYYIWDNRPDMCEKLLADLLKHYPDSITFYAAAQYEFHLKNFDKAIEYSEKILKLENNSFGSKIMIADCLVGKKMLNEALDIYKALKEESPLAYILDVKIYGVHAALAEELKNIVAISTDDDIKLKYVEHDVEAAIYKSEEIAKSINPYKVADKLKYYWLTGRLYAERKYFNKSLDAFQRALPLAEGKNDKLLLCKLILDMGLACYTNKDYEKAIEKYNQAISINAEHAACYYRKAGALNKLKRFHEAIECCNHVLNQNRYAQALYHKSDALLGLGALDEALRYADETLMLAPYAETYHIKFKCLYDMGRFDELLETLEMLRRSGAVDVKMLEFHAKTLVAKNEFVKADEIINEILEKEPRNFEALVQRSIIKDKYNDAKKALDDIDASKADTEKLRIAYGDMHLRYRQFFKAERTFRSLLRLRNSDVSKEYVYYRLGNVWENSNYNKNKAIKYYEKILKVNPEHRFANRMISNVYFNMQFFRAALPYAKKQLEIFPERYDYLILGMIYEKLKKSDKEKETYDLAEKLYPNDPFVNNNLGVWNSDKGNHEKAYEYFKVALENGHNEFYFWNNITKNLFKLEKYDEGIEITTKVIKNLGTHFSALQLIFRRACMYQFSKQFEKAIKGFTNYVNRMGRNQVDKTGNRCIAFCKIADCYMDMQEYEKAIEHFNKAIEDIKKIQQRFSFYPTANLENAYVRLGLLHKELKNYNKARKYFKKALGCRRNFGKYCYHLASVYAEQGKKIQLYFSAKRAILELKLAGLNFYKPQKQSCDYFAIAKIYKLIGNYKKSIEYFDIAVSRGKLCKSCLKSGCSEGHYELAEIYTLLGDEKKALLHLEKAKKISSTRFENCHENVYYNVILT